MEYVLKKTETGKKITVRMLQNKLLEMMKDIDKICQKNDINYFLAGGSCLGAVRHHGFIPWDYDMDIAMSRVEYNKFVKALKKDLGDKYVFHCYEKNKKYPVYWPAMKIRLKNTYIREANKFLPNPCTDSDGIFIDVFIYDYMSNNRFLDFILRIINTILMIALVFFENLGINLIPIKELYRFNARMYGKLCKNSKYFADEITWSFNPLKPFKYKYLDIYPTKKIKFEDTSFPVPGNYCEYLRKNYGDNYMEPISVEKQVAKHILDINLTSSLPNNNKYKKIWLIYRRGIQIGLIMNVVSLLLLNEASFILSGIGIIIICLAIMIYINEN